MANTNLAYYIPTNINIDKNMMSKWNSIRQVLKSKYIASQAEVKPMVAERYRFDLYGLFKHELMIDELFIYPHMIVNDYDCSNNYDGGRLRFNILQPSILETYYRLFNKK